MLREENLPVFHLLRYCIELLFISLLSITLLRIFDVIYRNTTLTWVYIGIVPTLKKLTVFMDKFPPEQEKEARKGMMVSHVLKFTPDIDNEFFKALLYEGRGELMLPIVNLKVPHISLDYCSNSNFMLASILKYKPNPYTVQLLFPALVKNMKSWHYEDQEVFVGFVEMLGEFNRDYQKLVKRLF